MPISLMIWVSFFNSLLYYAYLYAKLGKMVLEKEPEEPCSSASATPEENDLWERQPGESTQDYHLFTLYRDFGPTRNIKKIYDRYHAKEFEFKYATLMIKSRRYKWLDRAEAYDDFLSTEELKENKALIMQFRKKVTKRAMKLMDKAWKDMEKDDGGLTQKESRERYKLGFETFRQTHGLDKEEKVEHAGSITMVFDKELEDV